MSVDLHPEVVAKPRLRAPTRDVKTARRLLVLIPTTFVVLVVLTRLVVTSNWMSREIAAALAEELAGRTRAAVQFGGVTFGWDFAPCFQNFEIFRFSGPYKLKATTKQACVEHWSSAVGSGFHAIRLRLDEPSIRFEGSSETSEQKDESSNTEKRQNSGSLKRGTLREIQVVFDDLRLDWEKMPFPYRFSDGSFGPIDGNIAVQMRSGQTAATVHVREPSTGTEINGRINPTDEGWDMSAGLSGDLVSLFGGLLQAAELDIRRLPTRGRIGAIYSSKRRLATVDLDLEQRGVDLANEKVSAQRLSGFTARQKVRVSVDVGKGEIALRDGALEVNGVPSILSLRVATNAGSPEFDIRADIPTTPLLKLIRSVPGAREPVFAKDVSPNVMFALSFSMAGALRTPETWQPKLEHRISGIGPNGQGSGLEILNSTFRYYPLTKSGRSDSPRLIGAASPSWLGYARIPYVQRRAVIVSEDSTFFFHHGLEIGEVQDALAKGMNSTERARGGSTITQQLVKNLFLTRDRTALRKLQELLLTFHLESTLSKEHIFELYMNIIEWGPDVYGLKEASLHYFGKKPESLSIREMVYLATIIPGPILYHAHFEQGWVPPKHNAKIDSLLERLQRLGNITEEQLNVAKEQKIRFLRTKREQKTGESPPEERATEPGTEPEPEPEEDEE